MAQTGMKGVFSRQDQDIVIDNDSSDRYVGDKSSIIRNPKLNYNKDGQVVSLSNEKSNNSKHKLRKSQNEETNWTGSEQGVGPLPDIKSNGQRMINSLRSSNHFSNSDYAQLKSRIFQYNEQRMTALNKRTGGFTKKKKAVDRYANQTGNFAIGRISPLGMLKRGSTSKQEIDQSELARTELSRGLNLRGRKITNQSPILQQNQELYSGAVNITSPNNSFTNQIKTIAQSIQVNQNIQTLGLPSTKSAYKQQIDSFKYGTLDPHQQLPQTIQVRGENPLINISKSHTSSLETLKNGGRSFQSKQSPIKQSKFKNNLHSSQSAEDDDMTTPNIDYEQTFGSKIDDLSPISKPILLDQNSVAKKVIDMHFVIQNRQKKLRKLLPNSQNSPQLIPRDESKMNVDIREELSSSPKIKKPNKTELTNEIHVERSMDSSKKVTSQDFDSTESLHANLDILLHFRQLQVQIAEIKERVQNVLSFQEQALSENLSGQDVDKLTLAAGLSDSQKIQVQKSLMQKYQSNSPPSLAQRAGGESNVQSTQFLPSILTTGGRESIIQYQNNSFSRVLISNTDNQDLLKGMADNQVLEETKEFKLNDLIDSGKGTLELDHPTMTKGKGIHQQSGASITPFHLQSGSTSSPDDKQRQQPKLGGIKPVTQNIFQNPKPMITSQMQNLPLEEQNRILQHLTKVFTFLIELNEQNNTMKSQVYSFISQLRANLNQVHAESIVGKSKSQKQLSKADVELMSRDLLEKLYQIQSQNDLLEQVLNLNTMIQLREAEQMSKSSPIKHLGPSQQATTLRRNPLHREHIFRASMPIAQNSNEQLKVTGQQFSQGSLESKIQLKPMHISRKSIEMRKPQKATHGHTLQDQPSSRIGQKRKSGMGITEVSFRVDQHSKVETDERKVTDTNYSMEDAPEEKPDLDFFIQSSKLFESFDKIRTMERDFNVRSSSISPIPDHLPDQLGDIHTSQLERIKQEVNSQSVDFTKERGLRFLAKELMESISHKPFLKSKPYMHRQLGWSKVRFDKKLEEWKQCLNQRYDKYGPSEKVKTEFHKLFSIPEKPKKERVDTLIQKNIKELQSAESLFQSQESLESRKLGASKLKTFMLNPDVVINKYKHLDSKDFLGGLNSFKKKSPVEKKEQQDTILNTESSLSRREGSKDKIQSGEPLMLMTSEQNRFKKLVSSLNNQGTPFSFLSQSLNLNYNYGSKVQTQLQQSKMMNIQEKRQFYTYNQSPMSQGTSGSLQISRRPILQADPPSATGMNSKKSPTSFQRTRNLVSELKSVFQGTKAHAQQIYFRLEDDQKSTNNFENFNDIDRHHDFMLTGSTLKVNNISPTLIQSKETLQSKDGQLPSLGQKPQKKFPMLGPKQLRIDGSKKEHSLSTNKSPEQSFSPKLPKNFTRGAVSKKENSNMRIQITNTSQSGNILMNQQTNMSGDKLQGGSTIKQSTSDIQAPHYQAPLNQSPRQRMTGALKTKSVMDGKQKKSGMNKSMQESETQYNQADFHQKQELQQFQLESPHDYQDLAEIARKSQKDNAKAYNSYTHSAELRESPLDDMPECLNIPTGLKEQETKIREEKSLSKDHTDGNLDDTFNLQQNSVDNQTKSQERRMNTDNEIDEKSVENSKQHLQSEGVDEVSPIAKEKNGNETKRIKSQLTNQLLKSDQRNNASGRNNNSTLYGHQKTSQTSGVGGPTNYRYQEFDKSLKKGYYQNIMIGASPNGDDQNIGTPYETILVLPKVQKKEIIEQAESSQSVINHSASPVTVGGVMYQNNITNYPMKSKLMETQYSSLRASERKKQTGTIHNSGNSLQSGSDNTNIHQPRLPGATFVASLSGEKSKFNISQTQVLTPARVNQMVENQKQEPTNKPERLNRDLISPQFGISMEHSLLNINKFNSIDNPGEVSLKPYFAQAQKQSLLFSMVEEPMDQTVRSSQKNSNFEPPQKQTSSRYFIKKHLQQLSQSLDPSKLSIPSLGKVALPILPSKNYLSPVQPYKQVINRIKKPSNLSHFLQVNQIPVTDRLVKGQENMIVQGSSKVTNAVPLTKKETGTGLTKKLKKSNRLSFQIPDHPLMPGDSVQYLQDPNQGTPGYFMQPPTRPGGQVLYTRRDSSNRHSSKISRSFRASILRSSIHSKESKHSSQNIRQLVEGPNTQTLTQDEARMNTMFEKTKYQSYLD